jgi:Tfp pilus assembly protein PilO
MSRSAWLRLWYAWAIPAAVIVANAIWLFGVRGAVIGRGPLLAKQQAVLEAEVASLTAQRDGLARAQASLASLEGDLGALRKQQLGSMRERLVSFLVDIARRTQAAGLRPERISYQVQPDKKTGLVHFSATYNVTGSYEEIRRCVNLLEGSPQFVIVERLALRGDETAVSLEVSVQLTVSTFFADADTGMLRELGLDELPQVAAAVAAPAGEALRPPATPPAPQPPRTDFSSVDARVMTDLRSAVAGLSSGEAGADEDVFVAPDQGEPTPRPRRDRGRAAAPPDGARNNAFFGQLGQREVSGGR